MARNATTSEGIRTAGIHAPSVNLETTTTSATTAVAAHPMALIVNDARHRGSRSRRWCTTIPAWLRVNPVNTPNAYSGMRAEMLPLKMVIRIPAAIARKRMPLEKTSLSRGWPTGAAGSRRGR